MPGNIHRKSIIVAYGTRPEAIKLAPVIQRLQVSSTLRPVVAVSGQHREMLDQINRLFRIVPDYDLDIIRPGQTLSEITTRALSGYTDYFNRQSAAAVIVQGDTTTTLAAALSGFYCHLPVVHLEAGLRTGNSRSPFPEEINRRLTTQLADLHLAPTPLNRSNLMGDGVRETAIRVTGNTVIDAFLEVTRHRSTTGIPAVDRGIVTGRRILLVTAHRRESWGEPMRRIGRAVAKIARSFPDLLVVLPAHKNPVVREQLLPPLLNLENVIVTDPMDYAPFSAVIAGSTLVLTDSGGIQEEAPSVGKPVLVMRDTTERPEAVRAGTVSLIGTDEKVLVARTSELLTNRAAYLAMARATNPYGDGRAAARAVAAIESMLGIGSPLPDFDPPLTTTDASPAADQDDSSQAPWRQPQQRGREN